MTEHTTAERPTPRLTLSRETLRTLTRDELRHVAGGAISNSNGSDCVWGGRP